MYYRCSDKHFRKHVIVKLNVKPEKLQLLSFVLFGKVVLHCGKAVEDTWLFGELIINEFSWLFDLG